MEDFILTNDHKAISYTRDRFLDGEDNLGLVRGSGSVISIYVIVINHGSGYLSFISVSCANRLVSIDQAIVTFKVVDYGSLGAGICKRKSLVFGITTVDDSSMDLVVQDVIYKGIC